MQPEDGHYSVDSHKHRQFVLAVLRLCGRSGDVRMLGKIVAENEELLQNGRRSKTLQRVRAFLLDGKAFEDKHGPGAAMDLDDPFVKQLIGWNSFPAHILQNASNVSCNPELAAPRWRNYGSNTSASPSLH